MDWLVKNRQQLLLVVSDVAKLQLCHWPQPDTQHRAPTCCSCSSVLLGRRPQSGGRRKQVQDLFCWLSHCLAAAKPYGHLIRAVSTARFAHLIYKGSRAPLACAIRIAARRIGYCRDAHAVTPNVDIG